MGKRRSVTRTKGTNGSKRKAAGVSAAREKPPVDLQGERRVTETETHASAALNPMRAADPLDRLASLFGGNAGGEVRNPVVEGKGIGLIRPQHSISSNLHVAHEPLDQYPLALQETGRCRCWERRIEDNGVKGVGFNEKGEMVVERRTPNPKGERMNPYIYGHDARCYLYMAVCPKCGHHNGTHHWQCKFWDEHPDQQPF